MVREAGGTTHSDFAFQIFKFNYPSGCGPTVERRVVGGCVLEKGTELQSGCRVGEADV